MGIYREQSIEICIEKGTVTNGAFLRADNIRPYGVEFNVRFSRRGGY